MPKWLKRFLVWIQPALSRQRLGGGYFDQHPCTPPAVIPDTLTESIWTCRCGRSWRADGAFPVRGKPGQVRVGTWVEVMSHAPISEAEFDDLLAGSDLDD